MTVEQIIIIALSITTVALTVLLIIVRRRATRGEFSATTIEQFGDLLKLNSSDGSIQQIASQVSDLLVSACRCRKILFLRKRRGLLGLNYNHGMGKVDRNQFKVPFSRRLAEIVAVDLLPRRTDLLGEMLPEEVRNNLARANLNYFFPVFWKDKLYGLYFIEPENRTMNHSLKLLAATLAKQLSTAYHFKWHEAKLTDYTNRLSVHSRSQASATRPSPGRLDLTELLNYRKSDELIVSLVETIRKSLHMKRIAFLYRPKASERPALIVKGDQGMTLKLPSLDSYDSLVAGLSSIGGSVPLKQISVEGKTERGWIEQLSAVGLNYLTVLRLAEDRLGILAWTSDDLKTTAAELESVRHPIQMLTSSVEGLEQAEEMSFTDPLTGLSNQRYFRKRLDEEIGRCIRYNRKLALVFFDLDDLKSTNDHHGHLAGDDLLTQMGRILQQVTRSIDVVARYGGDEFCVIMPEADETTCALFMDRLRETVGNSEFQVEGADNPIRCTVSLGGAIFPDHAGESKKLIYAADMASLEAKAAGRNQSRLYRPAAIEVSADSRPPGSA